MQGIAGNFAIEFGEPGGEEGRWSKAIAPANLGIEVRGLRALSLRECRNQASQQIGVGNLCAANGEGFHGAALCRPRQVQASACAWNSRANSAMAIMG